MDWFKVDKKGLAQVLERRGKVFCLFELLQNALDTGATRISATLTPRPGSPEATLVVRDDDPDGFQDLREAYTLFAPSRRKADPLARGRFGIGEKLVLALAREATIVSTRGAVRFDDKGRHTLRRRRPEGTEFSATLRMTRTEYDEACAAVPRIIVPMGVDLDFNGDALGRPDKISSVSAKLTTELSDDEGVLRRRLRTTEIEIYDAPRGGWLYELGIPVCETGDKFHANILQKVPLNLDRDGVTPAYLRTVRVAILNATWNRLSAKDTTEDWVRDATGDDACEEATVTRVMDLQFGRKRVIADPSDPEANRIAVSKGYTVINGRALSRDQWETVRRHDAATPAGQVTPSPKPFSPGGDPLKILDPSKWGPEVTAVVDYATRLGAKLLGRTITVTVASDIGWPFAATYEKGHLIINLGRLGRRWFAPENLTRINELFIHEFAHEDGGHLTEDFDDAMARLGAEMTTLALRKPDFFQLR